MARQPIRFDDGAAYERGMGIWSQIAGGAFRDWLAPAPGLTWLDVGCGNGAFTELVSQRCAPAALHGVDPSEPQLAFARARPGTQGAIYQRGDALALPFEDGRFDIAVTALVIFFVPDPAKAVAEMRRVVRPGGLVATYIWDIPADGSFSSAFQIELRAMGVTDSVPAQADASRMPALRELWAGAGLEDIQTRAITVERRFADFDDFWTSTVCTPSAGHPVAAMAADDVERLRAKVRGHVTEDASGQVRFQPRANAIKGRVPL